MIACIANVELPATFSPWNVSEANAHWVAELVETTAAAATTCNDPWRPEAHDAGSEELPDQPLRHRGRARRRFPAKKSHEIKIDNHGARSNNLLA